MMHVAGSEHWDLVVSKRKAGCQEKGFLPEQAAQGSGHGSNLLKFKELLDIDLRHRV